MTVSVLAGVGEWGGVSKTFPNKHLQNEFYNISIHKT